MDVLLLSSNPDQSISPYKQSRNHGRIINNNNNHAFLSSRNENFSGFDQNIINGRGGVLILPPPPPLQSSFTSSRRRQPPLLPLPISKPYSSLNNLYGRNNKGGASPPTKEKNLISKKPKSSISPNKQESTMKSKNVIRLGPEPGNLLKQVSKVMSSTLEEENEGSGVLEGICGSSIFLLAPPPSSLPLPKFSLKPKTMSCNVEAAATTTTGIDAGATDDLRRLLRL
ncbi:hypothetical protein FRX31_031388 [Thalictrum thalictroides]|uniref:Uncharacterized protein n=1 Tax=Thalictrum thalictroides TaxID=46969 RepID=A0A7J6V4F2_THATH|nr:hypothetical protein FRX31_031388 [Thalictrum thalictroides]